jgi:hypothetical protein
MLKKLIESQPIAYRTEAQLQSALGSHWIPDASYNAFLTTPPRVFGEALAVSYGVAVSNEATATGESMMLLFALTAQTWFPGSNSWVFRWNCATGEFLGSVYVTRNDHDGQMTQSLDGSIWIMNLAGFYRLKIADYTGDADTLRDYDEFESDAIGTAYFAMRSVAIDQLNDRIVIAGNNQKGVSVNEWTSGEFVRFVQLPTEAISIAAEDETRAYVLTSESIIYLIDTDSGEVLSAIRTPVPVTLLCWDGLRRRLLAFIARADATDGACQSNFEGYYPIAVATHITTPIPLKSPRKYRQIPVWMRCVGDIGEPIGGAVPTVEVTGDATIARRPSGSDGNGDLVLFLNCDDAGSASITASIENGL